MSYWKKKEQNLFHTWDLSKYGLRYTLVEDTTYGHYNQGAIKTLKETIFTLQTKFLL